MKETLETVSEEEEGSRKVNLGDTKEIELPSLNLEQYVGKRVKVALVEEFEGKPFPGSSQDKSYFIKVSTHSIGEIKKKDGGVAQLCATRVFGLQQDEEGNRGWGKETKLGQFLKKMKVGHYRELVGKEVVVQLTQPRAKDGKQFLTF